MCVPSPTGRSAGSVDPAMAWRTSFLNHRCVPDSFISGGESRICSILVCLNRVDESPTLTFLNVIPIQAPLSGDEGREAYLKWKRKTAETKAKKKAALVAMCSSLAWDSPFFYRLGTYLALRSRYLHSIALPPTQTIRLTLSFLVVEIENFCSEWNQMQFPGKSPPNGASTGRCK